MAKLCLRVWQVAGLDRCAALACSPEGALQHCFVNVVAPELAVGSAVVASGREEPLPRPLAQTGIYERARQGARHSPRRPSEIRSVGALDLLDVGVQRASQGARQKRYAIAIALAIADGELARAEVDVLDAQSRSARSPTARRST